MNDFSLSTPAAPAGEGAPAPGDGDVVLAVAQLTKAFGATRALAGADFELLAGEVHALVGENGSGKSTLVKVLSGVHRPDSGSVRLGAGPGASLRSPRGAARAGIATVFQEVLVVEPRSVFENVWLGTEGVIRAARDRAQRRRRAAAVLEELLGEELDLDRPVEQLSLSERQACCLARALVREPRILILDEATSALDVAVRDRLFAVVRRLTAAGTGVIFISHRMDEIAEIADRCTVMRGGETVATLGKARATTAELVRLMTGAAHLVAEAPAAGVRAYGSGDVVLRAEDVTLVPGAAPVDFEVRAGEMVGLAGLEGHGQDAFLRALWGGRTAAGRVVVPAGGGAAPLGSPHDARQHGIAYVPRERRAESLFESRSIRENFGLVTLSRDVRGGLVRPAATRRRLAEYAQRLRIVLGDAEHPITTLSGGNQQKVVMARWLATAPRVLLLNDPTRGVDLGAKRDLYALLGELASDGVAVVMLSTELDEHVELMDRVLVFREQTVSATLPRGSLSRAALVAAYFGEELPGA